MTPRPIPLLRHAFKLLGLASFLCVGAVSQTTPSRGSLTGLVRLADTDAGARGANVFLVSDEPPRPTPTVDYVVTDPPRRGEFSATSDASGKVDIVNVEPGTYFVVAQVPGYISPEEFIPPRPLSHSKNKPAFLQHVTIEPGKTSRFDLALERGGVIEGHVSHRDGSPLHADLPVAQQAALTLLIRGSEGQFGHAVGGAAHTDSAGRYRFDGLPAAQYVVLVAVPDEMVPTRDYLQAGDGLLVLSGGTARLSKAQVVDVNGPSVQNVDIVLPGTHLHRLAGAVKLPDGKPLSTGLIRLYPTGEKPLLDTGLYVDHAVPLREDGSFLFTNLLEDQYTLALDNNPSAEVVGLTSDGKGLKMHVSPTRFSNTKREVTVGPLDQPPITLSVTLNPQ